MDRKWFQIYACSTYTCFNYRDLTVPGISDLRQRMNYVSPATNKALLSFESTYMGKFFMEANVSVNPGFVLKVLSRWHKKTIENLKLDSADEFIISRVNLW